MTSKIDKIGLCNVNCLHLQDPRRRLITGPLTPGSSIKSAMSTLPAFSVATQGVRLRNHQTRSCSLRRPKRCAFVARASRLLVVELDEVVKDSDEAVNREFHERVDVDRKQSETTYIVYTSPQGYDEAMKHVSDNAFVAPDALVAVNGSEIFQRHYRVPDPYWEQTIRAGWDPKPIKWIISKFFEHELTERGADYDQEFEIHYECKDSVKDIAVLANLVTDKLAEMGLKCRVRSSVNGQYLTVVPAAGSTLESIEFCQKMLRIDHDSTYVYGSGRFVKSFVEKGRNWGISHVSFEEELQDEAVSSRVFLSAKSGTAGLLDGIIHFAVF